MFESLSDKLQGIFEKLRGKGRLGEKDVEEVLREVRLALLEADVNFRVVKDFVARVKEKATGEEVIKSFTPDQQVIRIVRDELVELLGGEAEPIRWSARPPTVFLLCGLQGSGKTTTAAKLAKWVRSQGRKPMLVAADVQRPAAIKQLQVLGQQVGAPVHTVPGARAIEVARSSLAQAQQAGCDVIILDTAGRLHVDDDLMQEVERIKSLTQPHETLLVVDATTGQDAVNVAQAFHERLQIDGVILTKLDGDARGGAALSLKAVTGKPVRFVGIGERADALELFYPDRMASRILGMGDVLSLIERVEETIEEEEAKRLERKMREATFNFEDFLAQMRQIRKLGPLEQILGMIPGFGQIKKQMGDVQLGEREMKRMEAIVLSMTLHERRHPETLNFSRKNRIAKGSGTKLEEVNELIKRFMEMRQMMKQFTKMESRMKAKKGHKRKGR
jgi:signal recognition particle subunit SRP54